MKIELRDPSELTLHPALKMVPDGLSKEAPEFIAFVEDVRGRGFDQPFQVDKEDRIIDGRARHRVAKQLQLAEVPVVVRGDDEVFGIIVGSLIQRRHYTKGQLAYVSYPLMENLFEEARQRQLAMLKKGNARTLAPLQTKTVEELAEQIGIARATFFQAKEIHQVFGRDGGKYEFELDGETVTLTLKEFFERRILDREDPAGLGAVLAGIQGMKATKGKAKTPPKQMELFGDAFDALAIRWNRIKATPDAADAVKAYVANLPEDLCDVLEVAIRARRKK
jgi:hypothetical protein